MHFRLIALASLAFPGLAYAAPTYKELVSKAAGILQATVGVIFWIIFFYVAWTLIQTWARHGDSPEEIKKGKNTLIAGVIGLVILGSLWGLVAFVRDILIT